MESVELSLTTIIRHKTVQYREKFMFTHSKRWLVLVLFLIGIFSFAFLQNNLAPQTVHAMNATMIVNAAGNASDANPNDGICAAANGNCTLRAAIEQANAAPGEDKIEFAASITSVAALDLLIEGADPVIIDGKGLVTIINSENATSAFKITSDSNQIVGVAITGYTTAILIEGHTNLIGTATETSTNNIQFSDNATDIKVTGTENRIRNVSIRSSNEQSQDGIGIDVFRRGITVEYVDIANKDTGLNAYLPEGDIMVESSSFSNNNTAIDVEDRVASSSKLTVWGSTFTDNKTVGIMASYVEVDMQANMFTNNFTHINIDKSQVGYIYNNNVHEGEFGIILSEAGNVELLENLFEDVLNTTVSILSNSVNINFHDNILNQSWIALQVRSSRAIIIANNYIDSAPNIPLTYSANIEGSTDISVVNNKILGNDQIEYGLLLENITAIASTNYISANNVAGYAKSQMRIENVESLYLNNNVVGLNSSGDTIVGSNNGRGIHLRNIVSSTVISNIIGNVETAVYLDNVSDTGISHNFIGTDITGMRAFRNDGHGIYLRNTANLTLTHNVISANELHGVFVATSAENVEIRNNIIGLSADGSIGFGNQRNGIFISGATISGINITTNTISDNDQFGVWIQNNARANTFPTYTIAENNIGTSRNGETGIGNGQGGVYVGNAGFMIIHRNIIAGNAGSGIELSSGSRRVDVSANVIGQTHPWDRGTLSLDSNIYNGSDLPNEFYFNAEGTPLGNSEHGISVHGQTEDIAIGEQMCINKDQVGIYTRYMYCSLPSPQSSVQPNIITHNQGDGVRVADNGFATISQNNISKNIGLAINLLGDTGVDPLREGLNDGANRLVSPIRIDDIETDNGELYVTYESFFPDPAPTYFIDFYASTSCANNGSGEAEIFLVRAELFSSTDNSHQIIIPFTGASFVTAVVNIPGRGTSEVSDCYQRGRVLAADDGGRLEEAVCTLTTTADPTTVRVGPGENRGVFTTLSSGESLGAIAQLTVADGSEWWQLDQADVPGGVSANELWLNKAEVQASGCDDLPEGEAPPVIAPIIPTVTPVVIVEDGGTPPPSGGNNPPPCYGVSVSHSPSGLGSVNLSGSSCAGGYQAGTSVSAQATPNVGVVFLRWEGSCIGGSSTSANINFTINQSCSLTAYWSYIN